MIGYHAYMPHQLLATARQQAGSSVPPVKAAALLHIARVLTALDPEEAERVLDNGLALAVTLSQSDKETILAEGLVLAGAIAPERALRLLRSAPPRTHDHRTERLVRVMLDHGHVAQAALYLSEPVTANEYPFNMVPNVMLKCTEDATRLKILRGAIGSWKERRGRDFLRVFSRYWELLPTEEATQLTRDITPWVLREPDKPIRARIAPEQNGVEFTSSQDFHLFEIFNVLRWLEPDVTDSLLQTRQQLAAAAARFPFGTDSVIAELRPSRVPATETRRGYTMLGSRADLPLMLGLIEAEREGNFEPRLQEALRLYAEDSSPASPNRAARECWPSTQAFRDLLYVVGKSRGRDAVAYLERIRDRDLRLFAMIELAAALAGLPLLSGVRCTFRPPTGRGPES